MFTKGEFTGIIRELFIGGLSALHHIVPQFSCPNVPPSYALDSTLSPSEDVDSTQPLCPSGPTNISSTPLPPVGFVCGSFIAMYQTTDPDMLVEMSQ
jgi:hypothetical protein